MLEQLYNQQVDTVYKFFYIKCLNRHVAEDLTSQTFVKFVEQKADIVSQNMVKYLYGFLRHVWLDFLGQNYVQHTYEIGMKDEFEQYVQATIEEYVQSDLKTRAHRFIERLPAKQRVVAHKRLIEEMTVAEVAAELSVTKTYIKTTQYRAIKNLKSIIKQKAAYEVQS